MANTWNGMELNAQSLEGPEAEIKINEQPIISDPASSAAQSVMMGGGRMRKKATISGYLTNADYELLRADYYSMTSGTLITDNGSMTACIKELSAFKEPGNSNIIYTAVFIEA